MTEADPGFSEGALPFLSATPQVIAQKVEIGKGGRVVIPVAMRVALGVQEGDHLLFQMQEGELRVVSLKANLRQLQKRVMARARPGAHAVDDLIAERRREAAREWDEVALGALPEALQAHK